MAFSFRRNQTGFILCIWLTMQSLAGLGQRSDSVRTNELRSSPYQLRTGHELTLLGVGAATGVSALVLENQLKPLTLSQIAALNRADVIALDRSATYRNSPNAHSISDATLAGNVALVGLLAVAVRPMRHDLKTVAVMYVETMLLTNGIQRSVKNIAKRTRPYAYNPAVPTDEKTDRNTRQSFFSGHAANAFASAVFAGEVFRHYLPDSKWKPVVWVGALGLSSATAVLRYEAGRHYPTDLLAGAAFGSLIGWGIPKLHEVKNRSELGRRVDVQPWSNGQASGIYARLLVFSR